MIVVVVFVVVAVNEVDGNVVLITAPLLLPCLVSEKLISQQDFHI